MSKIFYGFSICVIFFMIAIGIGILSNHENDTPVHEYDQHNGDHYNDDHHNDDHHNDDHHNDGEIHIDEFGGVDADVPHMDGPTESGIDVPIVLWWTPFTGETGVSRACGDVRCFFTNNRNYQHHTKLKTLMFYGSTFMPHDLPVPRLPHHEWALLHEESPKNIYLFSHASVMTLFNHTCTFKRESDYPIMTQYLQSIAWLVSRKHVVSTEEKSRLRRAGLPLISYTHSDCDTASDRDTYVRNVMKLIPVDSYGSCLHNKDLPKHLQDPIAGMDHKDFYNNQAQYKFTFAFENGICDDYVTEKLWRALYVGSVPVVFGSPKVEDLLPSTNSAIIATSFSSTEELVHHLTYLDRHDDEYDKYLAWKHTGVRNSYLQSIMAGREWGIDSDPNKASFIETFECFVCKRIHENIQRESKGLKPLPHVATVDHYGCPRPMRFDRDGRIVNESEWAVSWDDSKVVARSVRYLVEKGEAYGRKELEEAVRRFHAAV